MAKQTQRLNARSVVSLSKPGLHADGDGLYLVVDAKGAKRWAFIFQWDKKRSEMGLGGLASVSLADARVKAAEARKIRAAGNNPIEVRKQEQAAREAAEITFGSFAYEYVETAVAGFHNDKHKAQWRMSLSVQRDEAGEWLDTGYCISLRDKRLDEIGTEEVLAVLTPIWTKLPETASRVRGRIERVLDAAKVKGYRSGENPALWRGHLKLILPASKKLSRGHHAALPYADMPGFMGQLAKNKGMGAKALRLTIMTTTRTGETRLARWSEFNLDGALWTIPAIRMKGKRVHRVPLTPDAVALLRELFETRVNDWVFPGQKRNKPISEGTMMKAAKAAGGKITVHGFRSSFRDWVEEATTFPDKLAEASLAHKVGDETELAYKRGDVLKKRGKLLEAWDSYSQPRIDNVVPMRRTKPSA